MTVQGNQYTTGHLAALGEAAYCDVHTTAVELPTEPMIIDPYDPTTWPGPEAFASIEDFNRFNPFDQSTWPEGAVAAGSQPESPTASPSPPAESESPAPSPSESVIPSPPPAEITPPVFSEEPYVPAA